MKRRRYRPMTCSACLMPAWDFLRLRCEFCGVTSEMLWLNRIVDPR